MAWSPAARDLVASGGGDDRALLWHAGQEGYEASGGAVAELAGHTDSVACLAFSGDGTLLASGGMDGRVRVWDAATGLCAQVGARAGGGTGWLAWEGRSGSGGVGCCERDAPASCTRLPTPLCCSQTLEGPGEEVLWLSWHPKGHVVLAGSGDFTAWMWLAQSGTCMQVFTGHAGPVMCGGFTPDGKAVVTGGGEGDATLRVWNPKTGECTATVQVGGLEKVLVGQRGS